MHSDGKGVRKVCGGMMAAEMARVRPAGHLAAKILKCMVEAQDYTAKGLAARSNPVCLAQFRLWKAERGPCWILTSSIDRNASSFETVPAASRCRCCRTMTPNTEVDTRVQVETPCDRTVLFERLYPAVSTSTPRRSELQLFLASLPIEISKT